MKEYIEKNLKTKMIGKNIIFYEEISSTQEIAKKLAERHIKNGSMVLTNKQTSGIGTHGRKWYTKENESIAFTLVLYPKQGIESLKNISIDVAVCMVDAIEEIYRIKLDIKKPNDIMCHNKKVGGILTQMTTVRRKDKIFVNWDWIKYKYCRFSRGTKRNSNITKKRI